MTTEAPQSSALVYHGSPLPLTEKARDRFDQDTIDLIAADVAKGANLATLHRFVELAVRYDLDPFAHEIWCADMTGRDGKAGSMSILVGRDGYLKVARRDPGFVDVYGDVIYSKDTFSVRHVRKVGEPLNVEVEHAYGNPAERGDAVGAWGLLLRDGKPDRYFYAPLAQYAKDASKSAWKYRDAMILKCMVSYLTRTTYGISGPTPIDEIKGGLELPDGVVEGTAREREQLPERIVDLFERARSIDPQSWRRNEVLARVVGAEGEVMEDEVIKLEKELRGWLEQNEPPEAEVVEEPTPEPAPEPVDSDGAEHIAALIARVADLETRLQDAEEGSEEFAGLSAELDQVQEELTELEAGNDPAQDSLL
jgi:hypothetical protein